MAFRLHVESACRLRVVNRAFRRPLLYFAPPTCPDPTAPFRPLRLHFRETESTAAGFTEAQLPGWRNW